MEAGQTGVGRHDPFSVKRLRLAFEAAVESGDEKDVEVSAYCDAYEEICRLLCQLGVVFSFVERDVVGKIQALRERLSKESLETALVSRLVEAEVEANGTGSGTAKQGGKAKGKVLYSAWPASFDLTRLHRALDFVIRLIAEIHAAENEHSVAAIARGAYAASLSPHHPFLVRQACNVSFFALPSKAAIAHLLLGDLDVPEAELHLSAALTAAREVYKRCDRLLLHNPQLPHIPQS